MLFRSQLVGDALIIFRLEASGHVALVGQEQLTIDLEPVRRQALDTHDKMRSIRVRPEIMSDTGLEIEPRVDRTAVEGLELGLLGRMAELAFALPFQPELVIVAAIPALDIPFISIAALLRPVPDMFGKEIGRAHV